MPESELRICYRLSEFRNSKGITRAALAKQIGINQFSLANIERGLAPVRFTVGYNFCQAFNRSMMWLATGRPPLSVFTPASREILRRFGNKWLFSQAYAEGLGAFVEAELGRIAESAGTSLHELDHLIILSNARVGAGSHAEEHFERTVDFINSWKQGMTDDQKIAFANQLADVCFRFYNGPGGKNNLTDSSLKGNTSSVKSEIKRLMVRVKKFAGLAGNKAALAKYLHVAPPRISEWLSGKKEPGGEYTLRLLKWVTEQEREK